MAVINNIRSVSVEGVGHIPLADKPGSFTPGAVKNEYKPGRLPGDGGFVESYHGAKLDLNINLLGGISLDMLNNIRDAMVTIRIADGSVYVMPGARCTSPVSVGDGDSKLTLESDISERIS